MTGNVEVSTVKLAMLLAADQIEGSPELFRFSSVEVPDCGTPGCAIGWMAYYLREMEGDEGEDWLVSWSRARDVFAPGGVGDGVFYMRMNDVARGHGDWHVDASVCAAGLRRLAEAY